jgi:ATP phosphoribosyltransferase
MSLAQKSIESFAIMGSDAVSEYTGRGYISEVLEPIPDLRFVLAATAARADEVSERILDEKTVSIGTSYPRTANRCLKVRGTKFSLVDTNIVSGCVEAILYDDERSLDAIFELVQTGDSLEQNGLEIVRDAIEPVNLVKYQRLSQQMRIW